MKAPVPIETECEKTIVQAAMRYGWLVHGTRAAMTAKGEWRTALKGHPGFPDLILVRDGQLLIVELKRHPNKVEPSQQIWLDSLRAAGVNALVLWVPDEMQAFIDHILPRRSGRLA